MIDYILIFIGIQLVFLIPSYFGYKKVVKRFKVKWVKFNALVMTLVMPILYTILFTGICFLIVDPIMRSKKINKTEWTTNVDSRYRMVNDLIDNNLLIHRTKSEVIAILGNDFKENCWIENTLCYVAYDPDNYAILDHFELVIFFNENGRVEKVEYKLI